MSTRRSIENLLGKDRLWVHCCIISLAEDSRRSLLGGCVAAAARFHPFGRDSSPSEQLSTDTERHTLMAPSRSMGSTAAKISGMRWWIFHLIYSLESKSRAKQTAKQMPRPNLCEVVTKMGTKTRTKTLVD
jgi:hypothetical protein